MTQSRIGVGVVGLSAQRGWFAQAHMPALAHLPQFEIRGLAASTPDTAHAAAEKYGVAFATDDPAELAARPDIDLVVVSVKVVHHRAPIEAALGAGKHVFCEWPLGTGLGEAEAMAALARARGVRGFVGLQARFQPGVMYVRDLIAQGYVGQVRSTSIIAQGGGGARGGQTVPQNQLFYLDRHSGGGMLNIPMGHTLDGVCGLFGELTGAKATLLVQRPTATVAETGESTPVTAPDAAAITGVLENGAVASFHYRTPLIGTGFHWEINGDAGALLVTAPRGHLQLAPLRVFGVQAADQPFAELPIPPDYAFADLDTSSMSSAMGHLYRSLADDLATGAEAVASFDHAVTRHRMIDGIERAALE